MSFRPPKRPVSDLDPDPDPGTAPHPHPHPHPAPDPPAAAPPPDPKKKKPTAPAFSAVVKSKLQSSTRTGQACDRCKVRKIRCDALPDGCSHCALLTLPCYVTDRVSGRTERRGYLRDLEAQAATLAARVRDLESVLARAGIQVHPGTPSPPPADASDADADADGWRQYGSVWVRHDEASAASTPSSSTAAAAATAATAAGSGNGNGNARRSTSSLPYFPGAGPLKAGSPGGYIGAGMDHAPLSSMSGSKLHIMGTVIETGSFDQPDTAEGALDDGPFKPRYNKSVQALLMSMMNQNPRLTGVTLPSREEAFRYAEWYFIVLEKFLPLLHKPTFWGILTRIYDSPGYTPSASEDVLVHMVFSTMLFHYGVRNHNHHASTPDAKRRYHDLSNQHYHYALGRFYELLCERSLQAAQAIALLAVHARNFPKPHAAVILGTQAMGRVWSLGLHVRPPPGRYSPLQLHMRRRLFWVVMVVNMTTLGAMGRSMLITNRDYDVDFPEPVADEDFADPDSTSGTNSDSTLAGPTSAGPASVGPASGYGPWPAVASPTLYPNPAPASAHGPTIGPTLNTGPRPYPSWVGLATFKAVPLYLDLYSHLYSVRRDPTVYEAAITNLESRLQAWKASLPAHLVIDPCPLAAIPAAADLVTILYLQLIELQFRFLLRHPNTSMARDARLAADNVRICEGLADRMLMVVTNLRMLKSLDTTWTAMSLYGAFMFTMLASHWQRRETETAANIAKLRRDVDQWLLVINDVGLLIDAGSHAVNQMREIANRTLSQIEAASITHARRHPPPSNPPSDLHFLSAYPSPFNPAAAAAASSIAQTLSTSSFFHDASAAAADADSASDAGDDAEFPSSRVILPPHPPLGWADDPDDDDDGPGDAADATDEGGWREWARVVVENPNRQSLNNLLDAGVARPDVAPLDDGSEQWPLLTYGAHMRH